MTLAGKPLKKKTKMTFTCPKATYLPLLDALNNIILHIYSLILLMKLPHLQISLILPKHAWTKTQE